MTNDKNSLDLEKLSGSLKVLEKANNSLNNMSLSNTILELDNDLNKINFEHGNCFKDYKEYLDSLISEIDKLKREVNELDISLEKTINSFSDIEKTKFRKEDLLTSADQVTKIPEPDTTTEQTEVSEKSSINTIPIGLGIAASGIAGAAGMVAVDSMLPPEEKDPLPEYEENIEIVEKKKEEGKPTDEFLAREEKFDDVTPYHASRDKEVIEKFYDEEDK